MKDYNCKGQRKRLNQADTSNIIKYFFHHAATVASKSKKVFDAGAKGNT